MNGPLKGDGSLYIRDRPYLKDCPSLILTPINTGLFPIDLKPLFCPQNFIVHSPSILILSLITLACIYVFISDLTLSSIKVQKEEHSYSPRNEVL
jgi:hypothetical protein